MYGASGIDVDVTGRLNKCGGVNWRSSVHVGPQVRKRSDGRSIVNIQPVL
jgi:hypothetical protein